MLHLSLYATVNGRVAKAVDRVHVGALGNQELHDLNVALRRGHVQRRAHIVVARVDVDLLALDHALDSLKVALAGGKEQADDLRRSKRGLRCRQAARIRTCFSFSSSKSFTSISGGDDSDVSSTWSMLRQLSSAKRTGQFN